MDLLSLTKAEGYLLQAGLRNPGPWEAHSRFAAQGARLIQLMDCLALPTGFCLMEKRFVDVTLRYGFNENTLQRWRAFYAVKKDIEKVIGVSVYSILEGVEENTFFRDLEI